MAKLICILGYVIAIISVLSNAQIISINKNNQYANDDVQVDAAATHNDTSSTSGGGGDGGSSNITSTLNATTTIDTGRSFINATAATETEAATAAATVADAESTTETETTGKVVDCLF